MDGAAPASATLTGMSSRRQVRRLERRVVSLKAARDGLRLELDGAMCQLEGQLAEAQAAFDKQTTQLFSKVRA